MDVDYLGAEGGRLAMAFAAGCLACFTFMMMVGSFVWKLIGKTRTDRITELEKALEKEQVHCREMEIRLGNRIQQLEAVILFERTGQVAQNAQKAISEVHADMRELKNKIG